jgi:hypothetical protein
LAEQHEVPEVPGLGIEDPGRSRSQRVTKSIIAKQVTGRANFLGGPELHELAEQEVRPRERLGDRQPPDVASGKLHEEVAAHPQIISSEIARGTTLSARSAGESAVAIGDGQNRPRETNRRLVTGASQPTWRTRTPRSQPSACTKAPFWIFDFSSREGKQHGGCTELPRHTLCRSVSRCVRGPQLKRDAPAAQPGRSGPALPLYGRPCQAAAGDRGPQPAAFRRASICATSAVTCAFAKCSDALACCDVFVASDWIRPNTTRWRSVVGAGSASAAASTARASASMSTTSARRFQARCLSRSCGCRCPWIPWGGYCDVNASSAPGLVGASTPAGRYVRSTLRPWRRCLVPKERSCMTGDGQEVTLFVDRYRLMIH